LWQNSFQLMTFSLALFLTLVLFFLRTELLAQWQQQVPPDAPNHFLVNIAANEKQQVEQQLTQAGLQVGAFYPMVSGRVTAVNKQTLAEPDSQAANAAKPANNQTAPARQGFGRELNLTWLADLPQSNKVTAGQWFSADSKGQVSVEKEQAERLQLKIGDTITFAIGGEQFDATVSSFRQVDWNSLQPNFFMILSPDLMEKFPAVYLTAVYLPEQQQNALVELVRQFPTISVISVGAILAQVNDIIDQVSLALTFILLLVFAAAVLVLTAQTQASIEQRQQELAILRTLGAKGRFLRQAVLFEFAALGLLAGIFATVLTELVLALLQVRMFDLAFRLHTSLWAIGPILGVVLLTVLSVVLLRGILKPAPAQVIRQTLFG
jgi:putative ABC transport system permease protein